MINLLSALLLIPLHAAAPTPVRLGVARLAVRLPAPPTRPISVLPGLAGFKLAPYAAFPNEIKSRMLRAADQTLAIGLSDEGGRGRDFNSWNPSAVDLYRLTGLAEGEIAARVGARIDANWDGAVPVDLAAQAAYREYAADPRSAAPFVERLGFARAPEQGYKSYEIAATLAGMTGDSRRGEALFLLAIRRGRVDNATDAAEAMQDNAGLLLSGQLARLELERDPAQSNHVWHAIQALKRVQGVLKERANEALSELSRSLIERFPGTYRARESAIQALRSTGIRVDRYQTGNQVQIITKLDDPRYAAELRALIEPALAAEGADGINEEVIFSLAALGDADGLRRAALKLMAEGRRVDGSLRLALAQLGDIAGLVAVGDHLFAHRSKSGWTLESGNAQREAAEFYAAAGSLERVRRVYEALGSDGVVLDAGGEAQWAGLLSGREPRPGFGRPLDGEDRSRIHAEGAWREIDRLSAEIKSLRIRTSGSSRGRLVRAGQNRLAAGDAWKAIEIFQRAGHQAGLLAAIDVLLNRNEGFRLPGTIVRAALSNN